MLICLSLNLYILNKSKWFSTQKKKSTHTLLRGIGTLNNGKYVQESSFSFNVTVGCKVFLVIQFEVKTVTGPTNANPPMDRIVELEIIPDVSEQAPAADQFEISGRARNRYRAAAPGKQEDHRSEPTLSVCHRVGSKRVWSLAAERTGARGKRAKNASDIVS